LPEEIKKISVIMPVYNGGKYIRGAIKSILEQSFKGFEFIIVDDGSTDNTAEVVKSFTDSRIIYKHQEHKGTSAAMNYGISLCRNEWVARIDADDLNTANRLEKQIEYLNENPGIDVLSSWSVYFEDPAKILFLLREPVSHNEIHKYLDLHNPINQSAMIFRKSIFAANKFNGLLDCNEDFELLYKLRDEVTFAIIPEFLVYTRLRPDSRTLTGTRENMFNMLHTAAFKKIVDSKSKGEHFYWASVIAWLSYFYGSRYDCRSYFRNSFSLKNTAAYLTTFLPDKYFFKFINSHIRYRLKDMFTNKSSYKKELNLLLK